MSKKQDTGQPSAKEPAKKKAGLVKTPAEEEAKEKAKLLEASLEKKVGLGKWLASVVTVAHRLKEVLLGDKREQPSFDYPSRYMVVFTEPDKLELKSEKYGFDSFLHQILNDREKLALV